MVQIDQKQPGQSGIGAILCDFHIKPMADQRPIAEAGQGIRHRHTVQAALDFAAIRNFPPQRLIGFGQFGGPFVDPNFERVVCLFQSARQKRQTVQIITRCTQQNECQQHRDVAQDRLAVFDFAAPSLKCFVDMLNVP